MRYAQRVKRMGGYVLLRGPKPLKELIGRCPYIDEFHIEGGPLPDFDTHIELLSLPWLLGTTLQSIPDEVPYIFPDESIVEYWRRELSHIRAFRIGVNWQGNPKYRGDRHRSIPLAQFGHIANLPGVRSLVCRRVSGPSNCITSGFPSRRSASKLTTLPVLSWILRPS